MVTYVFDTSAILRFLDGEAGFQVVREIFRKALRRECFIVISAVNWGELAGKLHKRLGSQAAQAPLRQILSFGIKVLPASAEHAVASAILSVDLGISYADSFGVELALFAKNHILVTADYGVKPAERLIEIEFLPVKLPA